MATFSKTERSAFGARHKAKEQGEGADGLPWGLPIGLTAGLIFPSSVVGAFADNEILQVLFFALVFAFALHGMGERGRPIVAGIERLGQAFFGVIRIVMYAAPVGAFGAMAFTIGKYGIDTLTSLASSY